MFETIMVPTDGSKFAEKAEEIAISMASKYNSRIVGVHVIDEKLIYPYDVLEDEGKAILKNLSAKAKKEGVIVDEILVFGNPDKDLITITKRMNADIVIVGTHGKKGLERLLLGSVAESIIKSVNVPVLLVK